MRVLKLDRDNTDRFLAGFVGRRLSGFVPAAGPRFEALPQAGQLVAQQEYVHPDGRSATITLTIAATPEGPRISSAVTALTLAALAARVPPGQSVPGGRARHAFWGAALREALPELRQTGVGGMLVQGASSGREKAYTFEQFAERSARLGAEGR